ncbi:MAG TPA: hypothetical protein VIW03_19180 [Anaeromyxobacter sp.]
MPVTSLFEEDAEACEPSVVPVALAVESVVLPVVVLLLSDVLLLFAVLSGVDGAFFEPLFAVP